MLTIIRKFENNRVFTEDEGWMLFRLAAIGEAVGWTLLISGITIREYIVRGNPAPVVIAGRLHGVLFLLYMTAAVGLYPTLRWSRGRAFVALLMSVPPYGSILFEHWAYHVHRHSEFKAYHSCIVLAALSRKAT